MLPKNNKIMFSINCDAANVLRIILESIKDSTTIEKRRMAALVMFEIVLNNIEDNGDPQESYSRLLQTFYNKAVQGYSNGRDSRFQEYVHIFEELMKKNEGEKLETRAHVVELVDKIKDRLPYSYGTKHYVEKLKSEVPSLAMKKVKRLELELNRLA